MAGLVIHVAVKKSRYTEVLSDDLIRIGLNGDCELKLTDPQLNEQLGTVLELQRSNGHYRIVGFDESLEITHNGDPVSANSIIDNGDEVRIASIEAALQFFPVRALPQPIAALQKETHVAPFIEQAAIESAVTARRDDAKVFLREFTRELMREINPSTKVLIFAIILFLVTGSLYLGFSVYKEIQRSRRLINDQNKQLTSMQEHLDKTNTQISSLDLTNQELLNSLSLAPKLHTNYGSGVCLISGSYIFVEQGTGRPLRFPEVQGSEEGTVLQNADAWSQLTPEGNGTIAEFEVVGTGFHVGSGYILTNRHVVQPWYADERVQSLASTVNGEPRLTKLMAFFPKRRNPLGLKLRETSQRDDLAVCSLDLKSIPADIPAIPLDKENTAADVGKNVVMMGYPSGPDRLLALLSDTEARSVQARYGSSLESLLGYLAERNLIKPLTTQGHITDQHARRIIFDAATAAGGSGAPVFGQSGRVIGINFAVFTETSASNFAVPVRFAIALLQQSGWRDSA
jgi:S1-C subfamily serine protease